jgi:hypothetical protein
MTGLSLEQRIDRVEARAEIAELCSAYCLSCDDRDLARLESLFTDDITIRSVDGAMNAHGKGDAIAMFNRMFLIRGPSFHWTHDRFVTFDDQDRDGASGLLLAHAETTPNGVTSVAAIRYHDRYRRIGGRWLFAERILSFLYYMPMVEFAAHFNTAERMAIHGDWRKADFPEALECWQDWHRIHRPAK